MDLRRGEFRHATYIRVYIILYYLHGLMQVFANIAFLFL